MAEVHGSAAASVAIPDYLIGTEAQHSRPLGRSDAWWSYPAALDAGPTLGNWLFWWGCWAAVGLSMDLVLRIGLRAMWTGRDIFDSWSGDPADLLTLAIHDLVLLGVLWFTLLKPHGWTVRPAWAWASWRWRWVLGAVALNILVAVCHSLWMEAQSQPKNAWLQSLYSEGPVALLVLNMVILAPLTEELLFRDLLFGALARTRVSALGAWLISSLWFTVLHAQYSWREMLMMLMLGLTLGWVRWRSGSLLACVLIHAALSGLPVTAALALRAGWVS